MRQLVKYSARPILGPDSCVDIDLTRTPLPSLEAGNPAGHCLERSADIGITK
jgi:hypothetical protein